MEISKEVPLTLEQAASLKLVAFEDWDHWQNRLRHIEIKGTRLILVGEEASVETIALEVKGILSRIVRQVFTLKAYGAFHSPEGLEVVDNLQPEQHVYIKVEESSSSYCTLPKLTEIFKAPNDKQVKVKQGKLESLDDIKVDVIICPTSPDCKLESSKIGKCIKKSGGDAIEKECKSQYASIKRMLNYGEVVKTGVGNLKNCKHILHVVGPNKGTQTSAQILKTLIQNCLADCEKLNCTTLAMPLEFNCSQSELSEALWSELSTTTRPIKELTVVDMDSNKLYQFKMALKNKSTGQQAATAQTTKAGYVYDSGEKKLYTGEIEVSVHNGDIVDVPDVEVIVNSTTSTMNLSAPAGTLAHSILQKAGNNIQDELNNKMTRFNITQTQGVMCSQGHDIKNLEFVYHASLVGYDGSPTGNSVKRLRQVIKEAIDKTKDESLRSIAIPALGSGILHIPMEIVAKTLFEEVNNFSQSNAECSVQRVVLVAYDKNQTAVNEFSKRYTKVMNRARKVEGWKEDLLRHEFELQVTILSLDQTSINSAAQKLQNFLNKSVVETAVEDPREEPALQRVNYEKKKALEGLQFSHKVSLNLQTSPGTINKMTFTGYKDDAGKAQKNALKILRA